MRSVRGKHPERLLIIMKTGKTSVIIGSAVHLALVIHPGATCANAGVAVSIGQNFTGSTDSLNFYADPSGAVSKDYFVEFNTDAFAVYSKTDGSAVQTLSRQSFWSHSGVTIPSTYGFSTPRVVYDPTVQRWFVAQAAGDTEAQLLLAVSATGDPTGAWNGALIVGGVGVSNAAFFVNLGLDSHGVCVSGAFAPAGSAPTGCTLLSFPKTNLLLIPPIITNRTFFGPLSAASYGYNVKPAICLDGSAGGDVLATAGRGMSGDNNSALFAFAVHNAAGPGPATLGSPRTMAVPTYAITANGALQPDGSDNLDDWNAAFTCNAQRVGNVLLGAASVQVGAHAGLRWYRVNATNYTLLESGTISDPTLDLYYPSIAANTNGTIVIACNASGANTFVSSFATVGQTVNGVTTFAGLLLLKAGVASYQNLDSQGNNNWGRFSTTCVDPTYPNIFWTINAYAADANTWSTQITQLLTSPSPQLSIANSGSNLLLSWPVTAVPFQLQSVPNLTSTNSWSAVVPAATTNGATVSVLTPATNSRSFFRLSQ
jgi:hypothetical protein